MVPEVGKGIYSNFSVTLLTYPTCFYLFFEVLLFSLLASSGRAAAISRNSGYSGRPSAGRPKKISYEKKSKNREKIIPIVFFGILSTQTLKYS